LFLNLKSLNPIARIKELMRRLRQTEEQLDQVRREKQRLEDENARLREENTRLRKELETARRVAKRQAAPFSRGQRKNPPKSPGRKAGKQYGKHHRRPIPDHVDEQIAVAAPEKCPQCSGALTVERIEAQYQEEIVRSTWIRRFDIPICRCAQCGRRVQGRHPLQTSDALGAAAVQVGPEALTLGLLMNKSQGLPHADVAAILKQGFHLRMSRSGICRAIQRVARKAEATWHALRKAARRSPLAHMDETGWRVDAQLRWLWAVVTEQITYCEILPGRGFPEASAILGAEYAGWLIHDGLQLYYKFLKAAHQSCVAHLIRRCRDMAEVATPTAAHFPLAVKQLLEQGLLLRDRYLERKISLHGLWTATGRLEAKLDRLLQSNYQDPANRRLAKHLSHERPYMFTFLYCPGLVDATNNLAERVMRILVVIRKTWGGNRTENGARAQAILTSVLCTARQQDKDIFHLVVDLLRSQQPKLLDILPSGVLSPNDMDDGPPSQTNLVSVTAHQKSLGLEQCVPLPGCVETLLPQMQQAATLPTFSSG
jgi:transposase